MTHSRLEDVSQLNRIDGWLVVDDAITSRIQRSDNLTSTSSVKQGNQSTKVVDKQSQVAWSRLEAARLLARAPGWQS